MTRPTWGPAERTEWDPGAVARRDTGQAGTSAADDERIGGEGQVHHYLAWKEDKAPDFVAEITSKSTRREDQQKKFGISRDILMVREYVLFDPRAEYLDPPLQGFRLVDGDYLPIEPVAGRLPSQVLGLHLERNGEELRFFDPATGHWLLTRLERQEAADRRAKDERRRAEEAVHRVEEERRRADAAEDDQRLLAEEIERLRREIEALRGR